MRLRSRIVPVSTIGQQNNRKRRLHGDADHVIGPKRRRTTADNATPASVRDVIRSVLRQTFVSTISPEPPTPPAADSQSQPFCSGPSIASGHNDGGAIENSGQRQHPEIQDENLRSENENEIGHQQNADATGSVSSSSDSEDMNPLSLSAGDSGPSSIILSGDDGQNPIASLLSKLPQNPRQESNSDTKVESLPKIGQYQLLKLIDETTNTYDALDLLEKNFVVGRRLDRKKHLRRLRLAHRLSRGVNDSEENRRNFELLFPPKTAWVAHKEETKNGEHEVFYYWFEPPNHGSLHAYVIERKKLAEAPCREYFKQICELVEYCHARGVIIRDLKLRKFVFADQRRHLVKLDDLDETAICPAENKAPLDSVDWNDFDREDDQLCDRHGCPAYVSPEILDLSKKWYSGKAADVWSLGVLLYVLLVGRYPFYDVTPAGLFTKIRQARVQFADHDSVKMETRLLIRTMLRRDPKERPSVTDVLASPWLQPKDYKMAFKNFSTDFCVFWKPSKAAMDHNQSMSSKSWIYDNDTPRLLVPDCARNDRHQERNDSEAVGY